MLAEGTLELEMRERAARDADAHEQMLDAEADRRYRKRENRWKFREAYEAEQRSQRQQPALGRKAHREALAWQQFGTGSDDSDAAALNADSAAAPGERAPVEQRAAPPTYAEAPGAALHSPSI